MAVDGLTGRHMRLGQPFGFAPQFLFLAEILQQGLGELLRATPLLGLELEQAFLAQAADQGFGRRPALGFRIPHGLFHIRQADALASPP